MVYTLCVIDWNIIMWHMTVLASSPCWETKHRSPDSLGENSDIFLSNCLTFVDVYVSQ